MEEAFERTGPMNTLEASAVRLCGAPAGVKECMLSHCSVFLLLPPAES